MTRTVAGIVLAFAVHCAGASTDRARAATRPTALDVPVILTQLPVRPDLEQQPGRCDGMLPANCGDRGRIVRVNPDGRVIVLTPDFAGACGADVSFDGERVLFAGKKRADDLWNIWEIQADGTGLRQVTQDAGNCRSPAYQATLYTIVSTKPWFQIMFTSDVARQCNEYGCGPAVSLYSCKLDGFGLRRLTLNLSDDLDPFLMQDGRVLLASWQRMHLERGVAGRITLFGVNTDGADYAIYCGEKGRRVKHMPCETTDGLVVFVEADRVPWDGAGQLAAVKIRRPRYTYQPITTDPAMLYHSPSPLPDGSLLVSRRPADGSAAHGVCRLDPASGEMQPVYDDPSFHDVHARALVARPRPDGRSSVVNEKYPTGKLYCLNAYITDAAAQGHIQPGMIKRLRVIEGVPRSASQTTAPPPGIPPIVRKRLLGVVPVEADGSFNIELPADVPVQLQTLDENGLALRTCGWIWVKHREPRGCIGCHEDPELTPENRFVQAVQKPSMQLTLPPERRRTVDFRRDVMPILAARCSGCHAGPALPQPGPRAEPSEQFDLRADCGGGPFSRAYASLLDGVEDALAGDGPVAGKYVHPGQARTSPLIWRLFGKNTSRPWDPTFDAQQVRPRCPPPGAEPLTEGERLAIVEWIDLGAPWAGAPAAKDAAGDRAGVIPAEDAE